MATMRCLNAIARVGSCMQRSMHTIVNRSAPLYQAVHIQRAAPITFSTRFTHSKGEGQEQFVEFLQEEIKSEKESQKALPKISGFKIETDGPSVKLIKKADSETVTVEFNVSNTITSIEDLDDSAELEDKDPKDISSPELESTPPFTVTISKAGQSQKLCMKCEFVEEIVSGDMATGEDADAFEIVEFAMVDDKWGENTYSVNAELMDGNMYDMLMLMLEERGIDHDTFSEELVNFCTSYEQKLYVELLQAMKSFVEK